MPLRAIISNEDVLLPLLNDQEWELLKSRVKSENLEVRLPCCGNIAYLRASKHGFHHFVHKDRDVCTTAPETWQHLKAKSEIVLACRSAGYQAITEATGDGWRADILAVKGNTKIAFEVQWSSQSLIETEQRQQRYKEAGIRGCWLFKRPPPKSSSKRDLPLFKLDISEDACTVIFNPYSYQSWQEYYERKIPLADFVSALLNSRIKFCNELRSIPRQKARIVFVNLDCWKCHSPYHVYYLHDLKTGCGDTLSIDSATWGNEKYYFNPQIVEIVREFIASPQGKHLKLGSIKKRFSRTVGHAYLSFGCPTCDAICGDFFLHHEIFPEARYGEEDAPAMLEKEITLSQLIARDQPHWCFPENGQFCCK